MFNCESNLILIWSANYVVYDANGATTFKIIDAKLYVSVETLSTQDNFNLSVKLKSEFNQSINWNNQKHQEKLKGSF